MIGETMWDVGEMVDDRLTRRSFVLSNTPLYLAIRESRLVIDTVNVSALLSRTNECQRGLFIAQILHISRLKKETMNVQPFTWQSCQKNANILCSQICVNTSNMCSFYLRFFFRAKKVDFGRVHIEEEGRVVSENLDTRNLLPDTCWQVTPVPTEIVPKIPLTSLDLASSHLCSINLRRCHYPLTHEV